VSSLASAEEPEAGAVLRIAGPLYASVCATLESGVRRLLLSGRRTILVDLADVPAIDAAGVGALVHVYNAATGAGAVLRITNASGGVRDLLTRVGLVDLLNAEPDRRGERQASGDQEAVEAKSGA
jgi:anti-anti-sigma factor